MHDRFSCCFWWKRVGSFVKEEEPQTPLLLFPLEDEGRAARRTRCHAATAALTREEEEDKAAWRIRRHV